MRRSSVVSITLGLDSGSSSFGRRVRGFGKGAQMRRAKSLELKVDKSECNLSEWAAFTSKVHDGDRYW
eukprot:scaffold81982_cov31-Tisochrysis_lutea.AAC.1